MNAPKGKKEYTSPKLETHGSVEGLTGQSVSARKLPTGGGGGGSGGGGTEERPFGS